MYKIDFKNPEHIYFIGIGGISMSGLAQILVEEGFKISGSDMKESAMTRALEDKGIRIFYGQKAENITSLGTINAVVYTAAVRPDNPEFVAAKNAGIPMLTRAELLGEIMEIISNKAFSLDAIYTFVLSISTWHISYGYAFLLTSKYKNKPKLFENSFFLFFMNVADLIAYTLSGIIP